MCSMDHYSHAQKNKVTVTGVPLIKLMCVWPDFARPHRRLGGDAEEDTPHMDDSRRYRDHGEVWAYTLLVA